MDAITQNSITSLLDRLHDINDAMPSKVVIRRRGLIEASIIMFIVIINTILFSLITSSLGLVNYGSVLLTPLVWGFGGFLIGSISAVIYIIYTERKIAKLNDINRRIFIVHQKLRELMYEFSQSNIHGNMDIHSKTFRNTISVIESELDHIQLDMV